MRREGRQDPLAPFKVAWYGLIYTFRTQRHMRFHIYVVIAIIPLALYLNVGLREVIVLVLVVSLVMIAEMFNSAIEATVDLVQPSYHPLAKFAKDISAGAVLITTIIAIVVGSLMILGDERWQAIRVNLTSEWVGIQVASRVLVGLFLTFLVVVVGKGLGKRGQVLRGGMVSGHAAFSFFLAGAVVFTSTQPLVSAMAILLAAIVAQSRFEAKIHTIFELSLGALLGTVVALVLFGVLPK